MTPSTPASTLTAQLRDALEEIANVLGTGDCSENTCPGCKFEHGEAASIARAALTLSEPVEAAELPKLPTAAYSLDLDDGHPAVAYSPGQMIAFAREAQRALATPPAIPVSAGVEVSREDYWAKLADLTRAKNLLVRLWDKHPEARAQIEGSTGSWFVWGADTDAVPAAVEVSEPPIKCLESWHQGFLASSKAQVEIDADQPKPLDDPRLQQLFGDAIEGALALGYQNSSPPPEGHWLWRFWNIGRAEAERDTPPEAAASVRRLRHALDNATYPREEIDLEDVRAILSLATPVVQGEPVARSIMRGLLIRHDHLRSLLAERGWPDPETSEVRVARDFVYATPAPSPKEPT